MPFKKSNWENHLQAQKEGIIMVPFGTFFLGPSDTNVSIDTVVGKMPKMFQWNEYCCKVTIYRTFGLYKNCH